MANGTWQQQGINEQIALNGAILYCSYGPGFDNGGNTLEGFGPNTSGWDDPRDWTLPGTPAPVVSSTPSAPTPALPAGDSADAPANSPWLSPEVTGPPGCLGSAALSAAYQAAPLSALRAQAFAGRPPIRGFNGIGCWQGWVVAHPIANFDGETVFSDQNGLHLASEADLRRFNNAVCGSASSPKDWQGPAGPANCGQF